MKSMPEANPHYTTRSLLLIDLTLFLAAGVLGTFAIVCFISLTGASFGGVFVYPQPHFAIHFFLEWLGGPSVFSTNDGF
jgi:hypothetical protein